MRGDCLICKISGGRIPSHRVHEDDLTLAFMDVDQVNPGHVIVAVRAHLATLVDLSPSQATAAFRTLTRVAQAVDIAFKPEGLTILQTTGAAAGHTVPHFHVHVLPRHPNDRVSLTWPPKNLPADELASLASQIRKAAGHPKTRMEERR